MNIPAQAYKIRTDRYFKRTVYLFLFLEQIQNLPNLCSKNGSAELLDFHNFGANFTKNVIQNLNFAVKMELWYQFFFSQYLFLRLRTVSQNIKQKNKFGAENGTVLNLKTLFDHNIKLLNTVTIFRNSKTYLTLLCTSEAGSFKGPGLWYIVLDPYRTNFRPINILVGHDYLIKVTTRAHVRNTY